MEIRISSVESEEGVGKESILFDLEVEVRWSEGGRAIVLIFDDQLECLASSVVGWSEEKVHGEILHQFVVERLDEDEVDELIVEGLETKITGVEGRVHL